MVDEEAAVEQVRRYSGAWWLLALVGLLAIAAGVIVLVQPSISLTTLAVIAGIFLLVDGGFAIVSSFSRRTENRGLWALLGVVSVIAGLLLVRHPIGGVVAIALLLGIWLIVFGLVRLATAFDVQENRALNMVIAVVEIVAGILIVANPSIGVLTLAVIVGITFCVRGIGLVVGAWALHGVKTELATPGGTAPSM